MRSDSQHDLRFLPVGLSVGGKPCLVVGGGSIGTRKVQNLVRSGATVAVVSPTVTAELASLADSDRIRVVADQFKMEYLEGAFLVVAATNDRGLNADIVEEATRRGALACDASSAERSQVIFGALLDADGATVAVFTDGHDPVLARQLRDRIGKSLAVDVPHRDQTPPA
jgi:siroheme synthase-like protein